RGRQGEFADWGYIRTAGCRGALAGWLPFRTRPLSQFGAADSIRLAGPAPLRRWLVGQPRMVAAVGSALADIIAAEVEVFRQGVAVRPLAGPLGQFREYQPPRDRHDDVLDRPQQLPRNGFDVVLCLQGGCPDRRGDGARRPRCRLAGGGVARLFGPRRSAGRAAATRKFQPVDLADYRVAADAPEMRRDLAGAEPLRPEFPQEFDAFVIPVHKDPLLDDPRRNRNPSPSGQSRLAPYLRW